MMSTLSSLSLIKVLLAGVAFAYLGLILFALAFGNKLTFPAPPPGYTDSEAIGKFPLNDHQTVSTLFLPNPGSQFLLFYQHGNGEDLQSILDRLKALHDTGFAVLAWDYPGYGTSDGKPTEKGVLEAAEKLMVAIPEKYGYPPERILLYGRSVGGGPAIWLATEHPVAGLILEGTFTSIFRVGMPIRLLPWDIFNNLSRIGAIQCPVLFLHGTADRTVPFSHGKALLKRAPEPKFFTWIEDGGHNDLVDAYPDVYQSSLRRFLAFIEDR